MATFKSYSYSSCILVWIDLCVVASVLLLSRDSASACCWQGQYFMHSWTRSWNYDSFSGYNFIYLVEQGTRYCNARQC